MGASKSGCGCRWSVVGVAPTVIVLAGRELCGGDVVQHKDAGAGHAEGMGRHDDTIANDS